LIPDEGKSSMLIREVPKVGKVLMAKVKGSTSWMSRRDAFLQKAPQEAIGGQELLNLQESFATVVSAMSDKTKDFDHEETMRLYKIFLDKVSTWHSDRFHKGCTLELQSLMMEVLWKDIDAVLDGAVHDTDTSIERAMLIRDVLSFCTVKDSAAMRKEVVYALASWQASVQSRRLLTVVEAFVAAKPPSPGQASDLSSVMASSRDSDLSAEDATAVVQALHASFEAVVESEPSIWTHLVSVWDVVIKNENLVEKAVGDDTDVFPVCRMFHEVLNPFVEFAGEMEAYQEEGIEKPKVDTMMDHFKALQASYNKVLGVFSKRSDYEQAPPGRAQQAWKSLWQMLGVGQDGVANQCREAVLQLARVHEERVKKASHYLSQITGGAPLGAHWYDGADAETDLGAVFAQTLEVTDTKNISKCTQNLELVVSDFPRDFPYG
jgi:hypothetical protein